MHAYKSYTNSPMIKTVYNIYVIMSVITLMHVLTDSSKMNRASSNEKNDPYRFTRSTLVKTATIDKSHLLSNLAIKYR